MHFFGYHKVHYKKLNLSHKKLKAIFCELSDDLTLYN